MDTQDIMKEQWDEIARENAFYGVLSLNDFENLHAVDLNKFWETGRRHVDICREIANLGFTQNLSVVEIGCGLGRMTRYFAELFSKVYALDISPEMLHRAKCYWQHLENIEWILGNGKDLQQIPSQSMDFVCSFLVLQHIPDPHIITNYIREAARVMKDDSTAFLQFRTLPPALSLATLKYHVSMHWPVPLSRFLRKLWDLTIGPQNTTAKFARKYEAWRGCALRPAVIEAVALESHLQVQKTGSMGKQYLGTQYTYYVFRKKTGG